MLEDDTPDIYELTTKQFNLFTQECNYWLNYFSLKNWEIIYSFNEEDGARASYQSNISGRIIIINLAKSWINCEPNDYLIKKSAFHEVIEILFAEISFNLKLYYGESIVDTLIHDIIRRMENTIFDDHYQIIKNK
jgi:hypothetical protein